MSDEFDLDRFVRAQDDGGIYGQALAELRNGRKLSHWMWFVFPQIAGLGRSAMARRYAISSMTEAQAYLAHPLLGPRLVESAEAALRGRGPNGRSAEQVFGGIDAVKLRSSMTLFARTDPTRPVFAQVLEAYYDGVPDAATEELINPH